MRVESIAVTKNQDGTKTIEARVEAATNQTVNIALPMYTTRGMNGKMNTSAMKLTTTTERTIKEAIKVEITASHARELVEEAHMFLSNEEKLARYEQQSDTVTIIRL